MRRLPTVRELEKIKRPGRFAIGHGGYLQISQWLTRSWVFRYVRDGKARHVGMGSTDYVTLQEAREKAIEYRRLLARGGDPLGEKHGTKLERQRAVARSKTFKDIALEYIDAHQGEWRGDASRKQWTSSLERFVFPKIGTVPIADVGVTDILAVLDPIARKVPETARRVKHRLAKILDWAHSRDLRGNDNPARRPNLLPKHKRSKNHFAALPYVALPQFMAELRKLPHLSARALELLILTAARPKEIVGARWSEMDLGAGMWTIPPDRMKGGRRHRVPLCSDAISLLAALPRVNDFVFSGRFNSHMHVDGDGTEVKRKAREKRFYRAVTTAQHLNLIGVRVEPSGRTLVWLSSAEANAYPESHSEET